MTTVQELTRPRKFLATHEEVSRVATELGIEDRGLAERIADFVANEIEAAGTESAVLYFDNEGRGPLCSWCNALSGLCPHIAGRDEAP